METGSDRNAYIVLKSSSPDNPPSKSLPADDASTHFTILLYTAKFFAYPIIPATDPSKIPLLLVNPYFYVRFLFRTSSKRRVLHCTGFYDLCLAFDHTFGAEFIGLSSGHVALVSRLVCAR
uniref:Uncharacterized protein n=1 Tax=Grammatophora oceanica TaxID=210454 RepID=A0A7S1VAS1_9STRA|mmetsp:Transcript_39946/g.59273  ORF Transcript_39946/g.59273 Transcript_39946/m.59273 type:complete len:121 (+) Transcript_39946:313-675(+)